MGMSAAKGVSTPRILHDPGAGGVDMRARRMQPEILDKPMEEWPGWDNSEVLEEGDKKRYQSVAALLNFSALDRPEILMGSRSSCATCLNPLRLMK